MSKNQKEVDNRQLCKFLESEEYETLRHNLNKELNINNIHVNTKLQKFSNLITSSIPTFIKTPDEKFLSKKLKKEYKDYLGTLHSTNEKNELLKTFVKYANNHYGLCINKFILS